jgi:hypothetical protein
MPRKPRIVLENVPMNDLYRSLMDYDNPARRVPVIDMDTNEVLFRGPDQGAGSDWLAAHFANGGKYYLKNFVRDGPVLALNSETHPLQPKRPLGRPPLPPHARRRNRVNVYLTADQHNKLRALGGPAWVYAQLKSD